MDNMEIKTHKKINQELSGKPVEIKEGQSATVILQTTDDMVADKTGLIHGGFIFSSADYCAMLTVNHPNVVLAKSEVKFLKPAKLGDSIKFISNVISKENNKWIIEVSGYIKENKIFTGKFFCVITEKHVLENG